MDTGTSTSEPYGLSNTSMLYWVFDPMVIGLLHPNSRYLFSRDGGTAIDLFLPTLPKSHRAAPINKKCNPALTAGVPGCNLAFAVHRDETCSMLTDLATLVAMLGTIGSWVMVVVTVLIALGH
jgi:hypothetical protein